LGKFKQSDVDDLLVQCHRRCCICHRFCGFKIETDHIDPSATSGNDEIENAIAVCFECHAEIHSYNDQHPRGRKYRAAELRKHKEQWLAICGERPEVLAKVSREGDVGPLQALIDELEFNLAVSQNPNFLGSPFIEDQFKRAIQYGAIAILRDDLRSAVMIAYDASMRASKLNAAVNAEATTHEGLRQAVASAGPKIRIALDSLLKFLSSET
jgi:HNH endonuclease